MSGLLVSLSARLLRAAMVLVAMALLLLGGLWALAHSEAATTHLLSLVPGLKVVGPQGALLGDFKANRLELSLPRGGRLTLVDPAWQALAIKPDQRAPWHAGLDIARLSARRLELVWVPNPVSQPSTPLTDVSLPVSVKVGRLQIDEAHSSLWGDAPLVGLEAALVLQAAQPAEVVHRLTLAHLAWQGWALSGHAQLGVSGKMPLNASLQAKGSPSTQQQATGQVDLQVAGPLARLQAKGQATWQVADAASQHLLIQAEVAPFAAWPVSRLRAQAQALNLADLHTALPQTLLQGEVTLAPVGKQDLLVRMDIRNSVVAAWDAHGLPVRQLQGQLNLKGVTAAKDLATALHEGTLNVVAQLPSITQRGPATLSVKGGWGGVQTVLAQWQGLEPRALHSLAPPLQLQGSLQIAPQWRGGLADIAQIQAAVTAQAQGLYGQAFAPPVKGRSSVSSVSLPVSMNLSGRYGPGQFDVSALSLKAQDAVAELKNMQARWGGLPAWQVKGQGRVKDFDPQVWVPWPAEMKGRNQLSGQFDVAVDAHWRGQVQATIEPSVLGGVSLKGQSQWRSPLNKPLMTLSLDLDVGGNQIQAQADLPWRMDAQGAVRWGLDAQWQGHVHAPALQNLQAVAPLLGARQVAGVIEAQGKAQGIWPALTTQGQVSVTGLQWLDAQGQPFKLALAKADWQLDTRTLDAPAHVRLDVSQGQAAKVTLDQAQWTVDGSARLHKSRLSVDVSHKQGADSKARAFHLEAAAQGSWLTLGQQWRGQFSDVLLRLQGTPQRTLLQAQTFTVDWRDDDKGKQVQVGATSVNIMGVALRLQKLAWQRANLADDAQGEIDLRMQLEPLNLPALLDTWQPQAGWRGDLMLAGQISLKHSVRQPWTVDANVSRQSGDISLIEPTIEGNSAQRLGIRTANVALQARDGVWTLTENFEGRILGSLTGRQLVQASHPDQLPSATDPLSGELNLQIGSLRPWGAWAPAGWRLTGQLQAQAKVAGTLGAPEYRGQVAGQNLGLGQALMGVNLTDGQLQMELQGDHVHLTRLTAKSGSQGGSLSAEGQAVLGTQPEAQLSIKADRFALLQRVDRRIVVSGDAQATLNETDIKVDGKVRVDEGLIDITRSDAPTVGDDVNVLNRPGEDPQDQEDAAAATGVKRKLTAVLDVDLGHKLRLKGRGLDAFLAGALHLTTPANKPALQGTVRVENGTFAAYGQKLVIERGAITFTGSIENPRLDILAMRAQSATASASDVKVGVNITGTAQDPRVRLYSDPSMSETEKLSWLVLGRGPTGLGGADIGLLQSAAVALLSGEGTSPTDNLIGALGLDELSVRQTDGTVRDTVVNLGKQVSKFWYVGYERNLNATSGNWQLIYRLAQRFTVRAQAGDDNAVDFIWSWRWD